MNKVLEYMIYDKEYALSEICEVLSLKETRTKEILKRLMEEKPIRSIIIIWMSFFQWGIS